ncbi:MAG TPA: FtsW/RodA/SpoVE family cell cycle protein [Bryobacteraceae bacterium]|nr:FtsW/RodA/SpoVE family cell cycle protein [Bryobacteraceae bacterium]
MTVTRSSASERTRSRPPLPPGANLRGYELPWLLMASVLAAAGLWLVYEAKTRPLVVPPEHPVLDLRSVDRAEQLLPYLNFYASAADRQFAARKIREFLADQGGSIPNVGALTRIRVREREILRNAKLETFRSRVRSKTPDPDATVPLLTIADLFRLKPNMVVRDVGDFRRAFLLWVSIFFAAFYLVHLGWCVRGFNGETGILPALHMLTAIGLILMVSLRDPLRDTLSFANFAQGVAAGCVLMLVLSFVDFGRRFAGFSFVPLLASFLLSAALIIFGSGPGTSDAKVNLLGFQPVEAIKILLVLFLAGYFARNWELLRELREKHPALAGLGRYVAIPRLEYMLPVLVSIGLVLLFFFLQKDLGPALVFSCVFLLLYAVARNRFQLAAGGLALLIGGFAVGYLLGQPRTVSARVQMWLSPWDNAVRGGDQVVHSLWALSTGGLTGTGVGLGDPGTVPAAATDLVLSALGEEFGFAGFLAVFLLYAVLLYLGSRIALRAPSDYAFFLSMGLVLLIGIQVLLISGGILDLVPLSGVVTPFLSYGRTSMLANFTIFAILLSISRQARDPGRAAPFVQPVRWAAGGLIICAALILGKAAYVQVVQADATTGAGALVLQADGARRFQYNPRIMAVAARIPRGAINDRHGLPLATSNFKDLEDTRAQFAALGIDLNQLNRADRRYYPLGSAAYHLLGDLRTRANWGARNSSLAERDSAVQLQGYDDRARAVEVVDPRTGKPSWTIRYDYRELLPLLRHRWEPDHPDVKRIMTRERDLRMSIDARLQLAATAILARHLQQQKLERGALVVMDAETGDLLASASFPAPTLPAQPVADENTTPGPLLDRGRYGLYPPGSTFKIVTAMAALRQDPALAGQTFQCVRLPDGRVGNYIGRSRRPIRDDVMDKTPHGTVNLERGLTVSCNAYFAQLAVRIGPRPLLETAGLLGISVANPPTTNQLRDALAQAGYGQGQVVASPFQLARAAATIAGGGKMPFGRWVLDESNQRVEAPKDVLAPALAAELARDMRAVVTAGTGRRVAGAVVPIAGKTGTAELVKAPSHAWFVGFAPYGVPDARKIAFAMIVENGRYGGTAAAPMAADLVAAAQRYGIFKKEDVEKQ